MDAIFVWFQSNPWQIAFVGMLFLFVCLPFFLSRRRIKLILQQDAQWRELEQNIQELEPDGVRYFPNPTRHVLVSVLANKKGTARAGAVGPALDYLAAEVESPIRTLRSLSYLSVLIGLLGTVTLLALALQRLETAGQLKADLLKNIYPINAFAIGIAVVVFLSYSWYRHKGDQFLLTASRVLGRLSADQLGGADPVLLATLEKVGERFREWGDEIQERHLSKINHLVQEMRDLSESIGQVVSEAFATRREEEQAIVPLLRAQDAKMELLHQRLYQSYQLLARSEDARAEPPEAEPDWLAEPLRPTKADENRKKAGFFSRYFR